MEKRSISDVESSKAGDKATATADPSAKIARLTKQSSSKQISNTRSDKNSHKSPTGVTSPNFNNETAPSTHADANTIVPKKTNLKEDAASLGSRTTKSSTATATSSTGKAKSSVQDKLAKFAIGTRLQVKWSMPQENGTNKLVWWGCCVKAQEPFKTTIEYDAMYGWQKTECKVVLLKMGKLHDLQQRANLDWRIEDLSLKSEEEETMKLSDVLHDQHILDEEIAAAVRSENQSSSAQTASSVHDVAMQAMDCIQGGQGMVIASGMRDWIDFVKVKLAELRQQKGGSYVVTVADVQQISKEFKSLPNLAGSL